MTKESKKEINPIWYALIVILTIIVFSLTWGMFEKSIEQDPEVKCLMEKADKYCE